MEISGIYSQTYLYSSISLFLSESDELIGVLSRLFWSIIVVINVVIVVVNVINNLKAAIPLFDIYTFSSKETRLFSTIAEGGNGWLETFCF